MDIEAGAAGDVDFDVNAVTTSKETLGNGLDREELYATPTDNEPFKKPAPKELKRDVSFNDERRASVDSSDRRSSSLISKKEAQEAKRKLE